MTAKLLRVGNENGEYETNKLVVCVDKKNRKVKRGEKRNKQLLQDGLLLLRISQTFVFLTF